MYQPASDLVFETTDDEGCPVVFTAQKWSEKVADHPELMDERFIAAIQRTLEKPEEVWQNYSDYTQGKDNKRCYYSKHSPHTYVKVVVWVTSSPRRVVSAYEVDYVKESKYPELSRLR